MGSLSRGTKEELFSILPAGTVLPYAGSTAPDGWALCDGSIVSRNDYSELFIAIGTAWGQGDGSTTFHLPDLRGRFLRGTDNGAGRDANSGTRTAANTGGNTGDNVGTVQGDAIRNITGYAGGNYITSSPNIDSGALINSIQQNANRYGYNGGPYWGGRIDFNAANSVPTASDNRPINANMNYIIKL